MEASTQCHQRQLRGDDLPSALAGGVQNLQQITFPAKKKFAVGPRNWWTTSYVGGPTIY